MTDAHNKELIANLERAGKSIEAAKELAAKGFYDFVAARAYYGAFYAATALLLNEKEERSKHSGVIAFVHQRFVKPGILSKETGKSLSLLFELRNIGDYGGVAHVSREEATKAIEAAENFLQAVLSLLGDKYQFP